MTDETKLNLLRFAARPATPEHTVRLEQLSEKSEYRAALPFLGDEPRRRLRILYSNGKWELFSYALLANVLSESHEQLSLIFTSGIVECEGTHLRELFDGLQDEHVKTLVAYHPTLHHAPPDDAVLLRSIVFRAMGRT